MPTDTTTTTDSPYTEPTDADYDRWWATVAGLQEAMEEENGKETTR